VVRKLLLLVALLRESSHQIRRRDYVAVGVELDGSPVLAPFARIAIPTTVDITTFAAQRAAH
jgi:hypothetical protein